MERPQDRDAMQATSAQHVTEDNVLDFKKTGILEDVEIGSEADRSIRIEKIFKYVHASPPRPRPPLITKSVHSESSIVESSPRFGSSTFYARPSVAMSVWHKP